MWCGSFFCPRRHNKQLAINTTSVFILWPSVLSIRQQGITNMAASPGVTPSWAQTQQQLQKGHYVSFGLIHRFVCIYTEYFCNLSCKVPSSLCKGCLRPEIEYDPCRWRGVTMLSASFGQLYHVTAAPIKIKSGRNVDVSDLHCTNQTVGGLTCKNI